MFYSHICVQNPHTDENGEKYQYLISVPYFDTNNHKLRDHLTPVHIIFDMRHERVAKTGAVPWGLSFLAGNREEPAPLTQ